jgi:hypothetical protein
VTVLRNNPLTLPPIQMFSGSKVTVVIKSAYGFESYSLDRVSGAATPYPDVASAIYSQFQTPLKSLGQFHTNAKKATLFTCDTAGLTNARQVADSGLKSNAVRDLIADCYSNIEDLSARVQLVYLQLQAAATPDTVSAAVDPGVLAVGLPSPPGDNGSGWEYALSCEILGQEYAPFDNKGDRLVCPPNLPAGTGVLNDVLAMQKKIVAISGVLSPAAPSSGAAATPPLIADDEIVGAGQTLNDAAATMIAWRTDLVAYGFRLSTLLRTTPPTAAASTTAIGIIADPGWSSFYTRTLVYNADALNLVVNPQLAVTDPSKKKTIEAITVVFGDQNWEPSTGLFFSSLPIRSFSVQPIFTGNAITDKQIATTVLHPTVVPFVAANYRIIKDFVKPTWRSAVYLSAAAGVNPTNLTADFGVGPGISWRGLLFNAFLHYGHDVRLTQGLYVGQSLTAAFSGSIPTQTFWTPSFALGVSVRVPTLVGR